MKKYKTTYGEYTIGELIQALKKAVEDTPYLDMNSPVMISDYNMSGFKYELDVLPTFSQRHHTAGVCLFHSLNEPVEEEEIVVEPVVEEVQEVPSIMKFVNWVKN